MATFCCVAQKAASVAQAHLNKSDKNQKLEPTKSYDIVSLRVQNVFYF
jgi:hypothetical protein